MKPDPTSSRQRYLEKRALAEPWTITGIKRSDYSGAVVIPACDEERWLFRTLDSLTANPASLLNDFLIVVVVNHPKQADHRVRIANRRTLEVFTASPLRNKLGLGWVDACSPGFEPEAGGVGFARKLGFDLALSHLRSDIDPILVSLDADTLVDANYLPAIRDHFQKNDRGGAVIPFSHQPADTMDEQMAIDDYELYLRCYQLGLTLAGSPYAFHTIGSAFACRASAYVGCGGMNRRSGGEDFYFLQALAKTGGIEPVTGTTVYPAARVSNRVPFGTGPAIRHRRDNPDEASIYPLAAFELLGKWLKLAAASTDLDGVALQTAATDLDPALGAFMHRQKLSDTWDRLRRNNRTKERLNQAFHTWFDGLKTLQLLKQFCRTGQLDLQTAEEAIPCFFEAIGLVSTGTPTSDLEKLREWQENRNINEK